MGCGHSAPIEEGALQLVTPDGGPASARPSPDHSSTITPQQSQQQQAPQQPPAASNAASAAAAAAARKSPLRAARGGDTVVAAALVALKSRGTVIFGDSAPLTKEYVRKDVHKPAEIRAMLLAAVRGNVLFGALGTNEMQDLVDAMEPLRVSSGTVVIRQGDAGDNFYVVESGSFEIIVDGRKFADWGEGTANRTFGELALLYNSPRAATVRATTDAQLWAIDRLTFRSVIAMAARAQHEKLKLALRRGILENLSDAQLDRIADAATVVRYSRGDQIIRKGEEGEVFFIIESGSVICKNMSGDQTNNVLHEGDYFGERALLRREPRAADVFAETDTSLIALHREDFENLLGELREVLEHNQGMRLLLCVPVLAGLAEADRAVLFASLRIATYDEGQTIMPEGFTPTHFFIVKDGAVAVVRKRIAPADAASRPASGGGDARSRAGAGAAAVGAARAQSAGAPAATGSPSRAVVSDTIQMLLPGHFFPRTELATLAPLPVSYVANRGAGPVQLFVTDRATYLRILAPLVGPTAHRGASAGTIPARLAPLPAAARGDVPSAAAAAPAAAASPPPLAAHHAAPTAAAAVSAVAALPPRAAAPPAPAAASSSSNKREASPSKPVAGAAQPPPAAHSKAATPPPRQPSPSSRPASGGASASRARDAAVVPSAAAAAAAAAQHAVAGPKASAAASRAPVASASPVISTSSSSGGRGGGGSAGATPHAHSREAVVASSSHSSSAPQTQQQQYSREPAAAAHSRRDEPSLGGAVAAPSLVPFGLSHSGADSVNSSTAAVMGGGGRYAAAPQPRSPRRRLGIPFKELELRATLGTGTFGRVRLVHHRRSGRVFALKMLQKSQIVALKQQANIMSERELLWRCDHPFVIKLYDTYRDRDRLYMLLELVQGGELFARLQNAPTPGRIAPAEARFYGACVLDAFDYLHSMRIVYRDLKPENLLIDADGYLKLVDFGFAKIVNDKTYTLCGTPEYLAPELVIGRGHDKGVDYWALGVLLFEQVAGYSPFADHEHHDQMTICKAIIKGEFEFPSCVKDKDLRDLIMRLLQKDVARRLGCLRGGAGDVKSHRFFRLIDFDMLLRKALQPPWKPKLAGTLDTSNFEPYAEDDTVEPYVGDDAWDREF